VAGTAAKLRKTATASDPRICGRDAGPSKR
jgi:hypothetical protein